MIEPIKHFPVNWIDGMKISQQHLIDQEDYVIDSIRDANSLFINSYNYGLLAISEKYSGESIYNIMSTATNDAQLNIKRCSAITKAGYRIELTGYEVNIRTLLENIDKKQEEQSGDYYIIASVNLYEKIPFGEIDPEEIPPRHPNTQPKYNVKLVNTNLLNNNFSGGDYLVLGKVSIQSNSVQIDEDFIPPCVSIQSYPKLLNNYNSYVSSLSQIREYATEILRKAAHKNQNTVLANNVKLLCKTIINFISENYFSYKNIIPNQPPIFLINLFSKLALYLHNDIDLMNQAEKEEMLNYSLEWSEISPYILLENLKKVSEITYNHHNTGAEFVKIYSLLNSLETVFGKLSVLDYIGQQKENIIVNEQEVKSNVDPKKGWSVID